MRILFTICSLTFGFTLMASVAMSNQPALPLQYQLSQVTISVLHQTSRGLPGGYDITVCGDGQGHYVQNTVDKPLTTDFHISQEQLLQLINSFYHIHFFELVNSYAVKKQVLLQGDGTVATIARKIVDMESTKLCIQLGDFKKCVTVVDNQPREAALLVADIKSLIVKKQ